jgi:hypothetical protein
MYMCALSEGQESSSTSTRYTYRKMRRIVVSQLPEHLVVPSASNCAMPSASNCDGGRGAHFYPRIIFQRVVAIHVKAFAHFESLLLLLPDSNLLLLLLFRLLLLLFPAP